MSIADVFDALATARAYKPAFPTDTCFKILKDEAQRGWWDGDLVDAFAEMMREHQLDKAKNRALLTPLLTPPDVEDFGPLPSKDQDPTRPGAS
jgi:hypothetical protein